METEVGGGIQDKSTPTLTTLVPQEEKQKQKLMEKSKDPEQPDVKD